MHYAGTGSSPSRRSLSPLPSPVRDIKSDESIKCKEWIFRYHFDLSDLTEETELFHELF